MYIGRFAPSPTGPLHFGSLIAAVASYLESRCHNGLWLVRMEDLDPPREQAGAASDILRSLEGFGLEWDGEVVFQSQRQLAYDTALAQLAASDHIYPCTCTRKKIAAEGNSDAFGTVYPGTCRNPANRENNRRIALRLRTHNESVGFSDQIQGQTSQKLESEIGDFMLKRRDGLYAYHLAVVVDDAEQGITHIVRGYDLLDSTPRQIYVQQSLDLPTPCYAHLPIAVNKQGQKLSKQTGAKAIAAKHAPVLLWQALDFLGQKPDSELKNVSLHEIWQWAFKNWRFKAIPKVTTIVANHD